MNCQGLSKNKLKGLIHLIFFKSKNYSVYMLRDNHFTHKEESYIQTQWGFECYFSNFALKLKRRSRILNNNFECKVQKVERDDRGNMLIYGPNRDNPDFYKIILKKKKKKKKINEMKI